MKIFGKIDPKTTVIIAGLSTNGAALLRRFSRKGYKVCGLTHHPDAPGIRSRYGAKVVCANPAANLDEFVDDLRKISSFCRETPFILPVSDDYVIALDRTAPSLGNVIRCHGLGDGLRTRLTSKRHTFALADETDFPRPATIFIEEARQLTELWDRVQAPILIKPEFSLDWRTPEAKQKIDAKAITANSREELVALYERLRPIAPRLMAQEVIPGPDSNLIYWAGFVGADGRVRGRVVGQKMRVYPIHLGSASFVRLVDMPEVEGNCESFLSNIGYRGICGVELKIDPRDNVGKLIEVNARFGLWDDIGVPAGVDIAEEAVRAAFGQDTAPHRPKQFRQKWLHAERDLGALLKYRAEGSLSIGEWLSSLKPPIMVNDLPMITDWPYGRHNLWNLLTNASRKVVSMPAKPPA